MNCLAFERLLDGGELAALPAEAAEHVAACARCARSLARARALESALERHFAATLAPHEPGPSGAFTDRVHARVVEAEARGTRWLALPDAMPWWVRAAAEPAVAMAGVVAALLLWKGDALLTASRAWIPATLAASQQANELLRGVGLERFAAAFAHALLPDPTAPWTVVTATLLAVAPLLALAGLAAWRLGERLVALVAAPVAGPQGL